jgi:hypothetical protein
MTNLAEALPKEIARVRDDLIPVYQKFATGALAVWMMRKDIEKAEQAIAAQDTVEMLRAYQALEGYKL